MKYSLIFGIVVFWIVSVSIIFYLFKVPAQIYGFTIVLLFFIGAFLGAVTSN